MWCEVAAGHVNGALGKFVDENQRMGVDWMPDGRPQGAIHFKERDRCRHRTGDHKGPPIGIKLRKEEVKRSKGEPAFGERIKRENDLMSYLTERSQIWIV